MGYTNYPDGITSGGVPVFGDLGAGTGEIKHLVTTKADTDACYALLKKRNVSISNIYSTLATAEAALTADRNDTVLLYPGTHSETSATTWNVSNTALVGAHSYSPWSNSAALSYTGDTAAVSPLLTVSGSDCTFANIHFKDDCGHADHHNFLYNTGSGNVYQNCWFEGPIDGTQADDTSYHTVLVDGGGNYFKNCVFGSTASATAGAYKLGFTGSAYRTTFEDCIFYQQADAVGGVFIDFADAFDVSGPQFFKNCMFVSWWSNMADRITVAITGGCTTGQLVFDANCIFTGCVAVAAAGTTAIFLGHPLTADHDGTKAGLVENLSGTRP